jgi:integrase
MIAENPVDRVPKTTVERGRPEILTLNQVRSALKHLSAADRGLFLVSVFPGASTSEAEALRWEHVKLDRAFLTTLKPSLFQNGLKTFSAIAMGRIT